MNKLKLPFLFFMFLFSVAANAQMVLEYDVITPNSTIQLPLNGTVNVQVDWGDGSPLQSITSSGGYIFHIYTSIGIKTITINGILTGFGDSDGYAFGMDRLRKVLGWDGLGLIDLGHAFERASILTEVPTSLPSTVTDIRYMFSEAIAFNQPIGSWNTSAVTNMSGMFYNAKAFNQPIGNWNTASVTDMSGMFWYNPAFNQPIDNWNTAAVKDMTSMFRGASSFNQPIGTWNTSAVTNMCFMFNDASAFNQPIGDWNTAAVMNMSCMFANASSFNQSIDTWNTSVVTNMSNMFFRASAFNQPIGSWNTGAVTNMSYVFYQASSFDQPIGNWNTGVVTDMSYMFSEAITFNQPIGSWNTSSVTTMKGMFAGTDYAVFTTFNQPIGSWNTSAVTDMSYMFSGDRVFNQPLGNWNTAAVTNMKYMFQHADVFDQPIGNWNTAAVTNMKYMFCTAYAFNQPIGNWNTAAVTDMSGMFAVAFAFNQPIGNWNTAAVTDMQDMFESAIAFNQPINSWNTSSVTNMRGVFYGARVFNQPLGSWNTEKVTNMFSMFRDAYVFNQPIGIWNTASVNDMWGMFNGARAFNQPIGTWNTSKVTNMKEMFAYASFFNQPLGSWNVAAVTNMSNMFSGVGLCTDNYDATLIGWSTQVVKSGVDFYGGISKYSALSTSARATLVSKGWVITDGGSGLTAGVKCMLNQVITFLPIPEKVVADASFVLTATVSSGLPVTYTSSNTAVATISGNTVTIVGVGVATITAKQTGNANYYAAPDVSQILNVQLKKLLSYNIIRGTIYTDGNADCKKQASEIPLSSIVVKAVPGDFYGYTDRNGNYEIRVDTGTISYTLTQQYNAANTTVLVNQCASSHVVVLKGASIDTASFDFANEVRACILPTVEIQHTQLIRCRRSEAYIQYCNLGNATMSNATIKVEYPAHLIPLSSIPMWTSKVGSTLFYDAGTLQEANCARIKIIDSVDCDPQVALGVTECIKASITPNSTCTTPSVLWDFSSTAVAGTCENNQAAFVLTNNGDGDMSDSLAYRIFVNDTLIYNGKYKLESGSTLGVRYPAQAQTVRLEADQHPNHPGNSHPKAIVERCGAPLTGFVAKGLVTTTSLDDLDEEVSIVCYPITGSFDPNDKQASPAGVGLSHQVAPGTELEYTIRFQNTGTAPAQTVKVVDTLDVDLDVASFIQSVSSHAYTLTVTGKGQAVLTFTFDNINLPDSTANKLGSNGLVSFKITIPSDIALGTIITNKAYIYFDYNDPILTNNTMHTVGITTIQNLSKGQDVRVGNLTTGVLYSSYTNVVKMYPNPSEGMVTLEMAESSSNMELRVTSVVGVPQKTIKLSNTSKQQVNLEGIRQGMYLYEIWKDGERSSVGTLQIW